MKNFWRLLSKARSHETIERHLTEDRFLWHCPFMPQTYTVEFHHQGQVQTIEVPEDQVILKAAFAAGIDLPSSCNAGVCTTCAAKILEGQVDQTDGMGVSPELREQGYALLCVAYPRSNLKIVTEKEDELYELQFGMSQK